MNSKILAIFTTLLIVFYSPIIASAWEWQSSEQNSSQNTQPQLQGWESLGEIQAFNDGAVVQVRGILYVKVIGNRFMYKLVGGDGQYGSKTK